MKFFRADAGSGNTTPRLLAFLAARADVVGWCLRPAYFISSFDAAASRTKVEYAVGVFGMFAVLVVRGGCKSSDFDG